MNYTNQISYNSNNNYQPYNNGYNLYANSSYYSHPNRINLAKSGLASNHHHHNFTTTNAPLKKNFTLLQNNRYGDRINASENKFRENSKKRAITSATVGIMSPSNVIRESKINRVVQAKPETRRLDVMSKINNSNYDIHQEKLLTELMKIHGDTASLIVPSFLYLGGHRSVRDIKKLNTQGITHVLNMAQELKLDTDELAKNNIKIMHIAAKDAKTYNIRTDFDRAFQFMDDALRTKGRIIVNCARGISRSATIVIAYLMFRYKMRLHEAFNLVVTLRPQVRPNSNFRRILEQYEQELTYNRYRKQQQQQHQQQHQMKSLMIQPVLPSSSIYSYPKYINTINFK